MLFFESCSELFLFITTLVAGATMVIGVTAVNSAPSFMLEYYKYVARDSNAVAEHPKFWSNVLTYYTVVTLVAQCCHEPTNLTRFLCRFSIFFRLQACTVLLLIEMLVILLLPHTGASENGAIAALMIVAYLGGMGRGYYENTCYCMLGPCPSKMLSGLLVGSAFSGVIVSAVQIALLSLMPSTFNGIITQSIIYFCFSIFIIASASLLLITLLYNSYAKKYIVEFRSHRRAWENIYRPASSLEQEKSSYCEELASNSTAFSKGDYQQGKVEDELRNRSLSSVEVKKDKARKEEELLAKIPWNEDDEEDRPMVTTSELLQKVNLLPVLRKIWVMMLTCLFTFGLTYLLYPGILIAMDKSDNWFTTLVMAVYNLADFCGRTLTFITLIHPPRRFIVIGSFLRVILVPLLFLCATHHIPSEAAAYAFTFLLGVSNGFVGTLSMVYTSETPGLKTAECSLASQATGVMLLLGCSLGSLIQIGEVIPFD